MHDSFPGPKTRAALERGILLFKNGLRFDAEMERAGQRGFRPVRQIVIDKAEGDFVWDLDGKREPESERPYRAWSHPYSTIVCLIGWTIVTLFQAYAERETALYAVAMVAVSWPVYRYLTRK